MNLQGSGPGSMPCDDNYVLYVALFTTTTQHICIESIHPRQPSFQLLNLSLNPSNWVLMLWRTIKISCKKLSILIDKNAFVALHFVTCKVPPRKNLPHRRGLCQLLSCLWQEPLHWWLLGIFIHTSSSWAVVRMLTRRIASECTVHRFLSPVSLRVLKVVHLLLFFFLPFLVTLDSSFTELRCSRIWFVMQNKEVEYFFFWFG